MRKTLQRLMITFISLTVISTQLKAQFAPTDDFDGDGIVNSIDIDDDNDGVLDSSESLFCTLPAKSSITVTSDIATGGGILANILDGTNTNNYWYANNANCINKNLFEFTFPQAINLTKIEIATSTVNSFLRNTVTYRVEGWNGITYIDLTGIQSSTGATSSTTTGGNTLSVVFNFLSNTGSYTKYRIYGLSGTTNSDPYIRETFFTSCSSTFLDTDADMIGNQFDLDSDGDGCSDAFEAGATSDITTNFQFPTTGVGTNGLANSLETVSDNGILNYTSNYISYSISSALNYCNVFKSTKGKVFMDFDGNSIQSTHTKEPGVKNVTVRAYKVNGTFVDAITDSLGEYSFSGADIAIGEKVRLEFINLPVGFYDGFKSSGSNTTIQFVTGSSISSSANLALSLPSHFSSTINPKFVVAKFKRNNEASTLPNILILDTVGSRNANPPQSSVDNSYLWGLSALSGANVSGYPIPTVNGASTPAQVGSVMSMAWDKHNKKLYAGAYMRAFASLGTNASANGFGEGIIYQIPIAGSSASTPSVWLDLETLLGNDIAGTYIADGAHPGGSVYGRTGLNPNKIGYTGLGSIKMSADGTQMYVVNLNQLEVLVIPVGNGGVAPTLSSDIKRFKFPTIESPGTWANGNPQRAVYGLGVHPVTGRVYTTLTCTGPVVSNLKGIVYSFDPNDMTPDSTDFVKEMEVPMDILRPATQTNQSNFWDMTNHAWENVTANSVFYSNDASNNNYSQHTQPWLGEIVFDALPNGTFGMVIGERNRFHDLTNGSFYVAGSVVYRATLIGNTWTLENNGTANPLTSTVNWTFSAANRAGTNSSPNNRFFKYVGVEGAFGFGTLEHVPGTDEIFMPAQDNVSWSATHGIAWLNRINGERTRDTRMLSDATSGGYSAVSFTKSNNWGDIEMLADLPTIEIGNLVWKDTDGDGIQDPNETGIVGIVVELYQAGILVGSTTTDANGNYYFTVANVNLNGATGILPNTAYEIRVATNQTNLTGCSLTNDNTDATPNGDARDSDGSGTTTAVITLTTGNLGVNNHTFDIGFKPAGPVEPACLGDYVWNDINKDGIQNNGEVGVAGITVTLLDNTNNVLSSTLTDAYGYYHFCPLDPGSYKVGFTLPANYVFTANNTPSNDSLDSDVNPLIGITNAYILVSGDTNYTVDAGIYFQRPTIASVGNYVWLDVNQDGIQDPTEEGISGVTVTLCNSSGTVIATTVTDADGLYLFTNVTPGIYSVGFTKPVGLIFSPNNGVVTNGSNSDANPITGKTSTFTVNTGDEITTIDAGLYSQPANNGGLGDKVWNDTDQDGVQDPEEAGVAGVTVNLCQADGVTLISTTTTDAFGNYVFNNLPAGQYTVGFLNLPSGYIFTNNTGTDSTTNSNANPSTGKTPIVDLPQGQFNMTIDAGIYTTVSANTNSVGNYVWYDVNKNGIQETTELGVAGVTVKLYDNTNTELKSTSTNSDGFYLFPDLPNGDYHVGFSNLPLGYIFSSDNVGTDLLDSDPNIETGLTASVSLVGNTHDRSLDAGINLGNIKIGQATLGDLVWYDLNNNGLQDEDELGVPNVTVNLCGADGITILSTTKTDALGNYIFTGLDAGTYGVAFTNLPAGFTVSPKNSDAQGINGEVNSDVNPGTFKTDLIVLGVGEDNMNLDMGIVPPIGTASLGNLVWFDLNNDGLQTVGEPGVQGVTVTLCDITGLPLKTTTTDANGEYYFVGLIPDTYAVKFSNLPTGYTFTTQDADVAGINGANNSDANDTSGKTNTISLVSGENNPRLDAGIVSTTVASVGDFVWFDEDRDGIQDPTEKPIAGVLVTLYDNTNTPIASAITKPDGSYIFTNVTPGIYNIGFSNTPTGMEFTTQETNPTSNTGSNVNQTTGLTPSFTIVAGTHTPSIDAGLYVPLLAGLGNYVWIDANQNALQDPEETPVAGVLVTLYSSDGTTILATASTDGNGAYSFTNLIANDYVVGFSNFPLGFIPTLNIGTLNDSLNSDMIPISLSSGKTAIITLSSGEYNPNIDAGIQPNQGFPVTLKEFNVVDFGCKTNINWSTLQELNVSHFDIQRNWNNKGFVTIGKIKSEGNSQTIKSYSFTDINIQEGNNIYRLQIVDLDGKLAYTDAKNINTICSSKELSLFPNPATNSINLVIKTNEQETFTIRIMDMLGKVVYTNTYDVSHQTKTIPVSTERMANGMYNMVITNSYETKTIRFEKITE